MKKILHIMLSALALASVLCPTASAEDKVIDKSAKKAPEWLTGPAEGFLVVTVDAPSIAKAQKLALDEVTGRILRSVASNVSVDQLDEMSETAVDGSFASSTDKFTLTSRIKSANLPFLKGISLSKVTDIYWIKLRDKKTGVERYEYSVKYPFSRMDQRMLQAEFEELDAEKEAELDAIERRLDNITSLDDISAGLAGCDALAEYFVDNVRAAKVKSLKSRYNSLYKTIGIIGNVTGKGTAECALSINGRAVRCGLVPTVTSDCASNINVTPSDGFYRITFDMSDCLPDEENYLTVTFRIRGKRLEHRMSLNSVTQNDKFSVTPEGTVTLSADSISAEDRIIHNLDIRLTLNNRGTTDFGVKSLEVNVPGIATPLIIEDIDAVYTSRGIVKISCRIDGEVRLTDTEPSRMLDGRIMLVNPITGSIVSTRFSLPFRKNW